MEIWNWRKEDLGSGLEKPIKSSIGKNSLRNIGVRDFSKE